MLPVRRINLLFLVVFLLFVALGGHLIWRHSYQSLLNEHQALLDRFASHITAKLDKYAHIPRLLSKDKELIDALHQPHNSAQLEVTNRYLEMVNEVIQAADTYLLDRYGTTIAASNWNLKRSFIGRNFAWRPYFQQAIQGLESQYYALGSTSGQRGYYYAYPVIYAAEVIGMVVVKMDLSAIEENWQSDKSYFMATDTNNVVFMSSQPKWLFKSISPLNDTQKEEISRTRQYLDTHIGTLGLKGDLRSTTSMWEDPTQGWIRGNYIVSTRYLPGIALNIRVLSPEMTIFWDTFGFILIATMVFAIIYLALLLLFHRKTRQRQIERLQLEAKQKLEFLVMERTAELHAEIDERARTEQMLRQAQDELIQAAKLAVLGQMSASISHELNNPLAAIRSFADNGRRFLASGKPERAEDNLLRIAGLTDRMAKISEQLRSFARKSTVDERVTVPLLSVVVSARELMAPQIKSHRILFSLQEPETPLWVCVNPIQLEQVMINLLTNAIQALLAQEERQLDVSFSVDAHQVSIHVDDNGPGVGPMQEKSLFEPFYTTKKNGLGLGLSISQQIIRSMDGELAVGISPLGGARFTITLPMVPADSKTKS